MAFLFLMPKLYLSETSTGHTAAQSSMQPLHFSVSTNLAFLLIVTVNCPAWPVISVTSLYVCRVIRGWFATSVILGASTQMVQSFVGNTSFKRAIMPPIEGSFSTRCTSIPASACLLYTSDAADEEDSVDLGGRRIIKKK